MVRNESRHLGRVAAGLAIGMLVSAGVALLFAPERGAELRRVIRRRIRRAGVRGHDAWDDLGLELSRARRKLSRGRRRRRMALDDRESGNQPA